MALSKYRTFTERLQSLTRWPCRLFLDIDEVARAGFCYHQFEGDESDLLRCAFCRCTLANWKRDTNPWQEHATALPFCIHLMACKGIDYIFRSLQKEEVIGGHNAADRFSKIFQTGILKNLFAYGVKKITDLKQQSNENSEYNPVSTYMTDGGVKFVMPIRLHMTEFTSRRDTLNKIPEIYRRVLKLDEMADTGLYFSAPECLRCYYCGYEFQDWLQHDDPWQLHISQNPNCMHIILIKGDDFVQLKRRQICSELRKTQHNPGRTWKRKSGPDNEGVELAHVEHTLKSLKLSKSDDVKQRRSFRQKGEKRRQRCACCQQRRREKKLRPESTRAPGNCLQKFISKGNCVGPHACFTCGSDESINNSLCVSVCCDTIVCGRCVVNGGCPKCVVSNDDETMHTS